MKRKDYLESLHNKTVTELHSELHERQTELTDVKMQVSVGSVNDVHKLRLLRQQIAQVLTLINEKGL